MAKIDKLFLAVSIAATGILTTSLAFAAVAPEPQQVPEPGLFGIVAVGAFAVIMAARLHNRK